MSFGAIVEPFVDAWFRFRPHEASEKGYDRHLRRAPSFDPDDVARFRRAVARTEEALAELPRTAADLADAIDAQVLEGHLRTATFAIERLGWLESNPFAYIGPGLEAVETVEMRDDLDERRRREALEARLVGLARLASQAREAIHAPVAPYRDIVAEMLEEAIDHLGDRYRRGAVDESLATASDQTRSALDRYLEHLLRTEHDVRPFEPMGEDAYRELLAGEHMIDMPLDSMIERAEQVLHETRRELAAWSETDEVAEPPEAFDWRDVLRYYESELELVRDFVRTRELVTLPEGRIVLRETPRYLQALIPGAFYQPPPAFSTSRTGHLFVQPVPRRMSIADRRRFFERVSSRRLRNLMVHEVWPGHHVQLLHAANNPRPMRKLRDDDVLVEGWALYAEKLMEEQGLWAEQPSPRPLQALLFRAARVVVDIGIHTGRTTLAEASDWMAEKLGADDREWVAREVRRYAAEPTQALSYLVGRELVLELREEWREEMGPARFRLREFHDRLLAEGSIPIPAVRRAMLERAARGE